MSPTLKPPNPRSPRHSHARQAGCQQAVGRVPHHPELDRRHQLQQCQIRPTPIPNSARPLHCPRVIQLRGRRQYPLPNRSRLQTMSNSIPLSIFRWQWQDRQRSDKMAVMSRQDHRDISRAARHLLLVAPSHILQLDALRVTEKRL